jgi:hypothetical protein
LSAFTDDDLLENDIALAMASAPQSTVVSNWCKCKIQNRSWHQSGSRKSSSSWWW